MSNIFDSYEIGLERMSKLIDSDEFLALSTRLKENIYHSRIYSDTETRRGERAMIIDSLNRMALV